MSRVSLFASYLDKFRHGLLKSLFEQSVALLLLVLTLVYQFHTGRLSRGTILESAVPWAEIFFGFVVWHLVKAGFLLMRDAATDVRSYSPIIIVPGKHHSTPPEHLAHFRAKIGEFVIVSVSTFVLISYLLFCTGSYLSRSMEIQEVETANERAHRIPDSPPHFDEFGNQVVTKAFTIEVVNIETLHDLLQFESKEILQFLSDRNKEAPPYPLFGILSRRAKAVEAYDEETVSLFRSQHDSELRRIRQELAVNGLEDSELDELYQHSTAPSSLRLIAGRLQELANQVPVTIPLDLRKGKQ